MPFATLEPRESAVSACARAIRHAILTGEIACGARLPPERTLAETFGVNRVTVRSALAQLEAARLLSVRQGSGYVVRDFRREGGLELLPALARAAVPDRAGFAAIAADLLNVRRHLARAVLESLAANADASGIRAIESAVDGFATAAKSGAAPDRIAQLDMDVLAAMLDATRSSVLGLCLNPVLAVVAQLPALRDAMYSEPAGNVAGYRALLAWLPSGRADLIDVIIGELAARDAATLRRLQAKPAARSPRAAPVAKPRVRRPSTLSRRKPTR